MGAYAVPSNQPFIAKGPLKRKRERGFLDETMELIKGAHIEIDENTGEHRLMRGNEVIGKFIDEEEENE